MIGGAKIKAALSAVDIEGKKLRILITNMWLNNRTGSELYVYEIATALLKRDYKPIVYSPQLGDLAQDLRKASIPVIDDLSLLGEPPDLIHGQHHQETMTALMHFPGVPAVYFSHGWLYSPALPPHFPRIMRYVAVDYTVRDRLIYENGIPPEKVSVILNFFDEKRFKPRPPLPPKPRRALIFNNDPGEHVRIVREACAKHDITVDTLGIASGNPTSHPETILVNYDLIFAVARSAIESLAVGAAVILCNPQGLGSLVTSGELDSLQKYNFGVRTLCKPLTVESISREIARYDPVDAAQVSAVIRQNARQKDAIDQIEQIYKQAMVDWGQTDPIESAEEFAAGARYIKMLNKLIPEVLILERDNARAETQYLREEVNRLHSERDKLQSHVNQLTNSQQHIQAERDALRDDLNIIRSTIIFRFIANPIWRLRRWLMPEGSISYQFYRRVRKILQQ